MFTQCSTLLLKVLVGIIVVKQGVQLNECILLRLIS
jgi:hypothetical protein